MLSRALTRLTAALASNLAVEAAGMEDLPFPNSCTVTLAGPGDRWALLIANSNYIHLTPLRNPMVDVRLHAEQLSRLKFSTVVCHDLKGVQMQEAVSAFEQRLSNSSLAWVSFSGHGGEQGRSNLLFATDHDSEQHRALKLQDLTDTLAKRNVNGVTLVVLDACRTEDRSGTSFAAPRPPPASMILALSTSPGKPAQDGDAGKGSPFAQSLARMLESMTPETDFEIAFRQVVMDTLKHTNGQQRPWLSASVSRPGVLTLVPPPEKDTRQSALTGAGARP
jgi:uncharacterized caspase-like protein